MENTSNVHSILSIDIGIKNLGYSIISYTKLGKKELNDLNIEFDIFDISQHLKKKDNIVCSRCDVLINFLQEQIEIHGQFEKVIIERQVNTNTMAMELMYAITMGIKALIPEADIIIFDPKDKFLKLGLEYSTKSKAHKKQSIQYARKIISSYYPQMMVHFEQFDKKDDVSDAINQCLVWMLSNGFLRMNVENYKNMLIEH